MKGNIARLVFLTYLLLPCPLSTSIFCNYGEYFKNGKCYPCEEDTYSSYRNSESCFSCPPGSFNNKKSSKYIYDCSCDGEFYLNYVGNRCDMCSDLGNRFYCKRDLTELFVDNLDAFFKHKDEITVNYFDRCVVKENKMNVYPFMNNLYLFCKSPNVCLDTCGRCSENNEGFMCNNCVQNYDKNIFLKYATCRKCFHIVFIVLQMAVYFILSIAFFLVLFKCINVSLYFYQIDVYKKGTIYFLHYFREFIFYLSLILLLSFSNDLTETERENYTFYGRDGKEEPTHLHSGDAKLHYFLNIYLHNAFFDIIKIFHLNFLHFVKLGCLKVGSNRSKIYSIQIVTLLGGVLTFICFTLMCNLIFLYLRNGGYNIVADRTGERESDRVSRDQTKGCKRNVGRKFVESYFYPLLLHNFFFQNYVHMTFFYHQDVVEFFKRSIKIYYFQYMHVFLYVANAMIIFIFLSSYMCIGLFNYKRSYYDTATVCYDDLHSRASKFMNIPVILISCFVYYVTLLVSIYSKPGDVKRNYPYKYVYGFYTFLCKQEKYYYYIFKILFINILFLCAINMDDHLSFLICFSFVLLLFIFFSMFVNPYIEVGKYDIKWENIFFMFLFFFNLQLEQIRLVTYHICLRIILSFATLFIYTFILLYFLYFMLKDVYQYFSLYVMYVNIKDEGVDENEKAGPSTYPLMGQFYFLYYLKNKMGEDLYHAEGGQSIVQRRDAHSMSLDNYHVEKYHEVVPPKDMDYISHQCVLISPFIAETIVQLLFITKNINHIIRLRRNDSNVKIYNCLFENGYVEIQKTPIDRFVLVAEHIYKNLFHRNYISFRTEMTRLFTDLVRDLRCFKDVYIRECVARRIRNKYKISEINTQKIVYDENYEQKHINTFLYRLRGSNQNVDARHQTFSQLFPDIGKAVLKKNVQEGPQRKALEGKSKFQWLTDK
ncbi:conserved Plasmodium protein, unknown function [Plasmodium knowlesi strain H]|uniref:Tyrosine-protein kinase ephrin type A/B receptor-like domain-containing protein n=3 Tax=Plasmodium knowlesi TaxID=5850 RepID=A0A5E7X0Q2_PLAKH|nr:conserved Plasmodium protein, unknown function [Plasmodium knowlesi strain H]OTN66964.1 Uncharacterized protein PKNOH_S07439800 [Plasmodium knowlesi]CAA9988531.1 conserved Plasmodium protein, unknown function [Plasmodium knowlesi strain H]SBO21305.1 conserved Plasmodium protein, unknown function [Plasmodium knowlesi strain H]SBO21763.1 conserved Plasmodium protein, unknown function [Plasmodium knowlesi strain H]VVS78005.1 conserved Plasmodium protein, unknown function [Plasmodium knowlesi s